MSSALSVARHVIEVTYHVRNTRLYSIRAIYFIIIPVIYSVLWEMILTYNNVVEELKSKLVMMMHGVLKCDGSVDEWNARLVVAVNDKKMKTNPFEDRVN